MKSDHIKEVERSRLLGKEGTWMRSLLGRRVSVDIKHEHVTLATRFPGYSNTTVGCFPFAPSGVT
jgi:hypothetical protein